jgi:hypothetical protein
MDDGLGGLSVHKKGRVDLVAATYNEIGYGAVAPCKPIDYHLWEKSDYEPAREQESFDD